MANKKGAKGKSTARKASAKVTKAEPTKATKAKKDPVLGMFEAQVSPSDTTVNRRNPTVSRVVNSACSWGNMFAQRNADVSASCTKRLYRKSTAPKAKGVGTIPVKDGYLARAAFKQFPGNRNKNIVLNTSFDIEEVVDHPALDALRNPNSLDTAWEFEQFRFLSKQIAGNAYVLVEPSRNGSLSQFLLMPQWVSIHVGRGGEVEGYFYGRTNSDVVYFAADEIIHYKHKRSLRDPYYGMSPLEDVLIANDCLTASSVFENAKWLNGARPDYAIILAEGATQAQIDQMRAMIARDHKGPRQGGRELIMAGVGDIKTLGFTPKQMEWADGRQEFIRELAFGYHIPESDIKGTFNRAGSEQAADDYLRLGLRPSLISDASALTTQYLHRFYPGTEDYWFTYDEIVQEDKDYQLRKALTLVPLGIQTVDETRSELGYEPLPKEDDSAAAINPAEDIQAQALNGAQITGLREIARDIAEGILTPVAAKISLRRAFPSWTEQEITDFVDSYNGYTAPVEVAPAAAPADPQPPAEAPAAAVEAPKAEAKALEVLSSKEAPTFFLRLKDAQLPLAKAERDRLEADVRGWFKEAAEQGEVSAAHRAKLSTLLDEPLRKIFTFGGQNGTDEVAALEGGAERVASSGISWDQPPEKVLAHFDTYRVRLAKTISDNEEAALRDALKSRIAEGLTTDEATAAVRETGIVDADWKAERIALTESSRAYSKGNMASWKEVGVQGKRFMLAPGSCSICETVAKKYPEPVALDHTFYEKGDRIESEQGESLSADYEALDSVPLHPGCRCTIVPILNL